MNALAHSSAFSARGDGTLNLLSVRTSLTAEVMMFVEPACCKPIAKSYSVSKIARLTCNPIALEDVEGNSQSYNAKKLCSCKMTT